ncbi:MAG: DUF4358 domain-containing protein [Bacillota bacterium]|nr:DUF4358 domain-containing protein [Bacillota bacterium]
MKKIGIAISKIVLIVVFGLFMLVQLQKPKKSNANFEEVETIVMQELEEYGLEKQDNLKIKSTFSLDPSSCTNIAYYKAEDPMDVREVLIVQFDKEAFASTIEKSAQKRVLEQTNAFEGYGPEQVKLLKKSKIYSQVNYAIYVTSENSGDVLKVFKAAL